VEGNKGGMCLVKWDIVCRPKELGDLDIHDLFRFGRALRQRWCWYHWTDNDRPWKGMTISCDDDDNALFQASTVIKVDDGRKAIFWQDRWIDGKRNSQECLVEDGLKFFVQILFDVNHIKKQS
jgi:hypothetical protein